VSIKSAGLREKHVGATENMDRRGRGTPDMNTPVTHCRLSAIRELASSGGPPSGLSFFTGMNMPNALQDWARNSLQWQAPGYWFCRQDITHAAALASAGVGCGHVV